MKTFALLIAAAGVAAGFSGLAYAQTTPSFAQADTNHDGFVDFGEAQVAYPGLTENQFKNADANKDDKLTEAEYGGLGPATSPDQNNNSSGSQAPTAPSSQASNPS